MNGINESLIFLDDSSLQSAMSFPPHTAPKNPRVTFIITRTQSPYPPTKSRKIFRICFSPFCRPNRPSARQIVPRFCVYRSPPYKREFFFFLPPTLFGTKSKNFTAKHPSSPGLFYKTVHISTRCKFTLLLRDYPLFICHKRKSRRFYSPLPSPSPPPLNL